MDKIQLINSRNDLEFAQSIAQCGSWIWNLDDNAFTWSKELYRIYNLTSDFLEQDPWRVLYDSIHTDEKEQVRKNIESAVRKLESFSFEYRMVRPDGVEKYLWIKGDPFKENNRISHYVGIIQDITDRKADLKALRNSEEKWRSLTESSPDHIMILDLESRIQFINHTVPDLEKNQVVGKTCYQFFDSKYHDNIRHCFSSVLQNGNPDMFEVDYPTPDGTMRYFEAYVSPFNTEGKVNGFIVSARDISHRKQAEETIRRSEEELSKIIKSMQDTYYRTSATGELVRISPSVKELLGFEVEELLSTRLSDLYVEKDGREKFLAALQAGKGKLKNYEAPLKHKNGHHVWVSTNAHLLIDDQGNIIGVEGTTRDISDKKKTELQMIKLSQALVQSADSVLITDRNGVVEYINPAFEIATGFSKEEVLGRTPMVLKSGKMDPEFYERLWNTISKGEAFSDLFINRRKNGSLFYEQKTISPVKDKNGETTHFVATGKDVTEFIHSQERIQFLAQHDMLTELPNRALFQDRLEHAVLQAKRHRLTLAVLFLDLDRFKNINDSLGHDAGDELLKQLAKRLHYAVSEEDTVARLGGDEFAILIENIDNTNVASALATKLLETLSPAFIISGRNLFVSASIGISVYPKDGMRPDLLLRNADSAMYKAKDLGKNTYQFYSSDLSTRAMERLDLENNLRHALQQNEFSLFYQPQVNIMTGEVTGMEALIRWQHPEFGLVMPADFVFLLEETGLIDAVGKWVIQTACRQLKAWHAVGYQMSMSVNLSSRQCNTSEIVEIVKSALEENQLAPGLLRLEITESLLMRNVKVVDSILDQLNRLGVLLAIDDFGTGYSSLSYLKRFPISILKIDKSFTKEITATDTESDGVKIVKTIIAMGHTLKMQIIAEGVENEQQKQFFAENGCEFVQGFLLSRPLNAIDMSDWLKRSH